MFIYIHACKTIQKNKFLFHVVLDASGDDNEGVGKGGGRQFFIIFLPSEPSTLIDPLSEPACSSVVEYACSTKTEGFFSAVDSIDW